MANMRGDFKFAQHNRPRKETWEEKFKRIGVEGAKNVLDFIAASGPVTIRGSERFEGPQASQVNGAVVDALTRSNYSYGRTKLSYDSAKSAVVSSLGREAKKDNRFTVKWRLGLCRSLWPVEWHCTITPKPAAKTLG